MKIIAAGHGGQGVLELANYFSYYELLKGRHIAYTPSYGPESRGGKVKCYVIASDSPIDSPIVEEPDYLIVMNTPSMDYVPLLKKGGTLMMNSSLITREPERRDVLVIRIPATEIAYGLRNLGFDEMPDTEIAANSVMFGAYLSIAGEGLDMKVAREVFSHFFTGRKAAYISLNLSAVERGYEFARSLIIDAHSERPSQRV